MDLDLYTPRCSVLTFLMHIYLPSVAPHGKRNSLSDQLFLPACVSCDLPWLSALCSLPLQTLILNPKSSSDKQGRFFIMCILYFRLHKKKNLARLLGTCQSCWAHALSLLTLYLQSQEELIMATLMAAAGLGSFQKH